MTIYILSLPIVLQKWRPTWGMLYFTVCLRLIGTDKKCLSVSGRILSNHVCSGHYDEYISSLPVFSFTGQRGEPFLII